MTIRLKFPLALFLATGLTAALGGCSISPSQQIAQKEDHLSAAGFAFKPADTPSLQTMMATLPPHQFLLRHKDRQVFYVYADPTICGCLYVGDRAAYDRYQAYRQQQAAVDVREDALNYESDNWNWGPWMPGFNDWNPAWGNWNPGLAGPFGWE